MKDISIAYRCPACSEAVFGSVGAFEKESGKIRLKCACGESALEAEIFATGKVILTVPCLFCAIPHKYPIEKNVLLKGSFLQLPCPTTGLPAFFVGESKTVSDAVEENENEIRRIAYEAGINLEKDMKAVDQSTIRQQLLRLLGILKAEGRIICDCESKEEGELALTLGEDGVTVSCKKCGAKRFFRGLTTLDCEYLSDIDLLYLE